MDDALTPGLREELISENLEAKLGQLEHSQVERRRLEGAELRPLALRYASKIIDEWLRTEKTSANDDEATLINTLAEKLSSDLLTRYKLLEPAEMLTGILTDAAGLGQNLLPERPAVPLTANELLVNDSKHPNLGAQLRLELRSATDVDLICAFVIWSGVNTIIDDVRGVVERGGRVRVITTTYMGVTAPKALRALEEAGAEVKVAFDSQGTKLHAKAWILQRPRGLTTAFVGSSNLSHSALHAGLEWNVRLAEAEAASVIERMDATFETYWADDVFEEFIADRDEERLEEALERQSKRKGGEQFTALSGLDVIAHPHQRRMLEDLMVQRDRHGRHRNLVVAATGTGKTVVAALDYRALCDRAGKRLSLLFVAHREQILQQSRRTFADVMKDQNFGEILGGGKQPKAEKQVFAMIQSLKTKTVEALDPEAFDVVIVDEFHHAEAPSYTALLEHMEPVELLGLTATPERMDGKDVTSWFGGRIAVELRVWEAIDRGYLAPFQYFGVADGTDLSHIAWKRGGYDQGELGSLFTGNNARARRAAKAIEHWHPNPGKMRALGFCVSIAHAEYMAAQFTKLGVESVAISGNTPESERQDALQRLRSGTIRCIFSVDVLGEGVDVPSVDTILLLRPTQSATLFTQQIGRGLRLSEGKACLTIIDLIGQQHKRFRFEERLGAIVDERNGPVQRQAEEGFPYLPSGCSMVLDEQSHEVVLENLKKAAATIQWGNLVDEVRELGDVTLDQWAEQSGRRISELYRNSDRSWTRLRRDADMPTAEPLEGEEALLSGVCRLDHVDDPERTAFYIALLQQEAAPKVGELSERGQRTLAMLVGSLGAAETDESLQSAVDRMWPHEAVRDEICQLFEALDLRSERSNPPLSQANEIPIALHGKYTRAEILLAYGDGTVGTPSSSREGVRWLPEIETDLLFVTLRKSDRSFSPSTMYRDYAIARDLFHWESQNATHDETPTGQRYIEQHSGATNVILFVRENEKRDNGSGAPFTCLGPVHYVAHKGNRPMQITWKLDDPLPEALLEVSQLIAAA